MAPLLHYIDLILSVLKTINYLEFTFKNKVTTRIVLERVLLAKSQHIGYLPIIFLFTFFFFFFQTV